MTADKDFRRSNQPERSTRDADTRVADDALESPSRNERISALLGMMSVASIMPDVQLKEPGWHLCWLSSQNDHDTIHRREQAGYQAVKRSELVSAPPTSMKDGSPDDLVRCRELILYKLPADFYEILMTQLHHKMPLQQESGIMELIEQAKEIAAQNKSKVFVGAGMENIGKPPRRKPVFAP